MSGFKRHRRSGAVRRQLHLLRGRPAALPRSPADRAAPQRGGHVLEPEPTRSRTCSTSPVPPPRLTTPCSRGCSRRRTPTTTRPPATSAASPRARCATARRTPPRRSSTPSRRPACRREPEDGLFIDVELDAGGGDDLDALLHRHAARHRDPAGGRGGRRGLLALAPRRRPPGAQVHDIYDWLGFLQETLVQAASVTAEARRSSGPVAAERASSGRHRRLGRRRRATDGRGRGGSLPLSRADHLRRGT